MRISDWSSDVCSSDLRTTGRGLAVLRDADDRGEPAGRALSATGDAGDPAPRGSCDLALRRMACGRRARSPLSQPVDGRRRQAAGIEVRHPAPAGETLERKSVGKGKSVEVGVDHGGRGVIKKK